MLIEMELNEIVVREEPGATQIVILREKDGVREFPIFIGYFEAQQMYASIHGHQTPRPMTHDLIFNVIDGLEARLIGVCVDDLREDDARGGTFHGKLMLETGPGKQTLVDTRPSDAIVLAVKRQTPIYVEDHVLAQVGRETEDGEEFGEEM